MKQLNLFKDDSTPYHVKKPRLIMGKQELIDWKQRVFNAQRQAMEFREQQSLFDMNSYNVSPLLAVRQADEIDPFSLDRKPFDFYRNPNVGGQCLIYFVIDHGLPIVLYVGETKLSAKQRWGNHDCELYNKRYIELHRKYDLPVAINISFWYDTPTRRSDRLKLEESLIKKFKSPFNKENWALWGQPFCKEAYI
ncbi:MAG: GIY-YIG nuclease family protein [Synechococcaceae cyanobacterium RL_1_2]|nr:GIY-YIG nuclease family protein [Synechococcaceae cyanobacterium RL_1_2]